MKKTPQLKVSRRIVFGLLAFLVFFSFAQAQGTKQELLNMGSLPEIDNVGDQQKGTLADSVQALDSETVPLKTLTVPNTPQILTSSGKDQIGSLFTIDKLRLAPKYARDTIDTGVFGSRDENALLHVIGSTIIDTLTVYYPSRFTDRVFVGFKKRANIRSSSAQLQVDGSITIKELADPQRLVPQPVCTNAAGVIQLCGDDDVVPVPENIYSWDTSTWSACGSGRRYRTVSCRNTNNTPNLSDEDCISNGSIPIPDKSQSCEDPVVTDPITYEWIKYDWELCKNGTDDIRYVICNDSEGNTNVGNEKCRLNIGEMPEAFRTGTNCSGTINHSWSPSLTTVCQDSQVKATLSVRGNNGQTVEFSGPNQGWASANQNADGMTNNALTMNLPTSDQCEKVWYRIPGLNVSPQQGCLNSIPSCGGGEVVTPSYSWHQGGFGACTNGTKKTSVWCIDSSGNRVNNASCPANTRPTPITENCGEAGGGGGGTAACENLSNEHFGKDAGTTTGFMHGWSDGRFNDFRFRGDVYAKTQPEYMIDGISDWKKMENAGPAENGYFVWMFSQPASSGADNLIRMRTRADCPSYRDARTELVSPYNLYEWSNLPNNLPNIYANYSAQNYSPMFAADLSDHTGFKTDINGTYAVHFIAFPGSQGSFQYRVHQTEKSSYGNYTGTTNSFIKGMNNLTVIPGFYDAKKDFIFDIKLSDGKEQRFTVHRSHAGGHYSAVSTATRHDGRVFVTVQRAVKAALPQILERKDSSQQFESRRGTGYLFDLGVLLDGDYQFRLKSHTGYVIDDNISIRVKATQ